MNRAYGGKTSDLQFLRGEQINQVRSVGGKDITDGKIAEQKYRMLPFDIS